MWVLKILYLKIAIKNRNMYRYYNISITIITKTNIKSIMPSKLYKLLFQRENRPATTKHQDHEKGRFLQCVDKLWYSSCMLNKNNLRLWGGSPFYISPFSVLIRLEVLKQKRHQMISYKLIKTIYFSVNLLKIYFNENRKSLSNSK